MKRRSILKSKNRCGGVTILHPLKNSTSFCPAHMTQIMVQYLALVLHVVTHPCGGRVVASLATRAQWLCMTTFVALSGANVENLATHKVW